MINQTLLLAGDDAYNLTKSLRFRSSASAYLNRTPASATSRTTWTWSAWVKRGSLGSGYFALFNAGTTGIGSDNTGFFGIRFYNDQLDVTTGLTDLRLTTQVFRDPSAWYHLVVAVDTTQATGSNRIKVYVNGSQVTAFATSNDPSQNLTTAVNNNVIHEVARTTWSATNYFDGYMGEVNFIDGQALTPSSFGETDVLTGVWKPKKYAGTYGTNGFYLPFTDVATTSGSNAGLGKDFSGNGNYWNTNNISVTAGSTYDSMNDVPTLTSATTANYAVLNPLNNPYTLSNANLSVSGNAINNYVPSTINIPTTGKFYFEYLCQNLDGGNRRDTIGVIDSSQSNRYVHDTPNSAAYISLSGDVWVAGTAVTTYATWDNTDIVQCAFDADTGKVWFGKNGTFNGSPSAGTGQATTLTNAGNMVFAIANMAQSTIYTINGAVNFGQRPFSYTPPTGFVALNTFNLPEPSIKQGNKHMDASLFTGTSGNVSVVNSGSFQPDFVWEKARSNAQGHTLIDSVRGANKYLQSNLTNAEDTLALPITFNSNGFTSTTDVHTNGYTYVAWQWKANGTGSSNTAGSITSTVSANPTAGFSVVTYTGNGSAGATVGHGLGVAPKMVIVKRRDAVSAWDVYHASIGATGRLYLNTTDATNTSSAPWNDTAPTSSVFTVGTATDTNASGSTIVAYCFAPVSGYSAMGSYTGNGSTDGTFVHLGFRPKFVMFKSTSATASWYILDSSRNPTNNNNGLMLEPQASTAEDSGWPIDYLSNGFKMRYAGQPNSSGQTYIYMAFAETPTKYALGR